MKKSQIKSTTNSVAKAVKSKKSLDTKALIAFGLASLLPSFACADESIKKIQEVFDSQDRDSQKIKKLDGYSPVVDLRSSSLGRNNAEWDKIFADNPVVINQDTTIGSPDNRWNVTTDSHMTKATKNITINNNATLTINATNNAGFGYRFAMASGDPEVDIGSKELIWKGGTIKLDFRRGGWGGGDEDRGGLSAFKGGIFEITSNLIYDYFDDYNGVADAGQLYASGTNAAVASNDGTFRLWGPKTHISINSLETDNRNFGLGGLALYAVNGGSIYLNADNQGAVKNANGEIQVTGGISTSARNRTDYFRRGGGKIYAHFTGANSWLKGNVYAGRYDDADNFSTLKMSFTNGAKMTGSIVFSGDAKESTSDILFANGSSLNGKILDLGVGNHKVTFDGATFTGSIKRTEGGDKLNEELKSIGVIRIPNTNNDIQVSSGTSNTIITFKNTRGQTFGNGIEDIVDTTYNGQIIGDFDMAKTKINGGTDGSKGFKGSGKNTLTFDFANTTPTDKVKANNFTISGGNKNSVYNLDRFTTQGQNELDLTTLSATDNLYSKIEKAGINIAAEVKDGNSGHLNGILQFRKTNIKVGEGDAALFAKKENILAGNNDLNGLAIGASFGNAIWNDTNDDGRISADEIKASGANYKLISSATLPTTGDDKSSTGNIGNTGDGVKKAINFIFTEGTYTTDGEKQGYTGIIKGGTDDSRYAFANAGFITQDQVQDSKGALVLFNTAFKGDLGVNNKAESIALDFSKGQSGLIGNIVGSGKKDIVFNFTGNTKKEKYTGAVVGKVSDPATAKFTMVNLKTYSSDGTLDGNGALKGTTIIEALKTAGLTNFNIATQEVKDAYKTGTDISELSKTNTTIALRGTSLDASNMTFGDYVYDFAFGSGFAPIDGIAVKNSTLSGVIDLSSNTNAGHRVEFRGNSLTDGTTSGITVKDTTKINLSFDDSAATYTKPTTFKIDGLRDTNKLASGSLKFSKTNLEGNLHIDENVAVDLNFTNGRTWKMSESSIDFKGGSSVNDQRKIIIHGDMKAQGATQAPILNMNITHKKNQNDKYRTLEMVNTGATLKLGFSNDVDWRDHHIQAFNLRGTSLQVSTKRNEKYKLQGIVWDDSLGHKTNFNLVFAKGTNKLETTMKDSGGKFLNITDAGTGEGNYIAESVADFDGFNTGSGFNMTLIGEESFTDRLFGDTAGAVYENNSKLDLVNSALTGTQLKNLFNWNNSGDKKDATIILQGTNLNGADGLSNINQSEKFTFNMAFIQDNQSGGGYVSDKYGDLATTDANGALKDKILKVAESKLALNGGLDFANATYNILFAGKYSHTLSDTNFIQGGTKDSTITFRNTDLNAGSGANFSLRSIKGKVIFDLTHTGESSTIIGTLGNMFVENGAFETQLKASDDSVLKVNKLVFSDGTNAPNLAEIGSYFKDADVFGTLSTKDYSNIAKIDTTKSSTLSFGAGTIAITNQDLVFIGTASHKFGETSNQTILGISTGSTLTFIDAGELKVANIEDGQGTINLVGSSKIELQNNKLTLGDNKGANLTINARFDGKNTLGDGVAVNGVTTGKGSNVDIGGKTEKTTYHLLFDYTDALGNKTNQGFGEYKMYQGNIVGLTDQSVIKFKNAGYIDGDQIAGTNARILVDNTQIKGDFRGDNGTLDYRKGKISVIGNILTSDAKASGAVLSRKELTFDFTGSSTKLSGLNDTAIQAGYKIATDYQGAGNSSLTFQNAPVLSLGNDTEGSNESTFIKAIANDIGFNIKDAKAIADGFNDATNNKASYILSGTELGFQGTTITATDTNKSITENLYSLNLSFDQRNEGRETNSLGSTIAKSSLTASSIKMGNAQTSSSANASDKKPLNLSLTFHDKGSLVGGNTKNLGDTLEVQLKNGAKFELEADSSNGKIGTLILSENIDGGAASNPFELAENSRLSIGAGSMSFVGNFAQKNDGDDKTKAGGITAHFNGTNQAYGSIAGRGDMSVTIEGNALLGAEQVSGVSGITPNTTADLIINTSNATKSDVTLAHTSGTAKVISKTYNGTDKPTEFTTLNLANAGSHTVLEGAFDFKKIDLNFSADKNKTLKISGNTYLEAGIGRTITLKDVSADSAVKLAIDAIKYAGEGEGVNLNLINLDSNITVAIVGTLNKGKNKLGGVWNIRGTNIELNTQFSSIRSNGEDRKNFIFAKGKGTETNAGNLKDLTTKDKINESALSGSFNVATGNDSIGQSFALNRGSFTFIGKESLAIEAEKQKIDGANDNNDVSFKFFNSLITSGSVLLDNTLAGSMGGSNWKNNDRFTLRGTDTFNLSLQTVSGSQSVYNGTIDAVFAKGSNPGSGDYISTTGLNKALTTTLEAYKTTNAGGALSETELKTLQSKAYGNITMADTVTATMKFIGDDSHSFDGRVAVKGGKVYSRTKSGGDVGSNAADWTEITVNTKGEIGKGSALTDMADLKLATLSGGNAKSRFDFDHTSVNLDSIKGTGGKTYVYNSTILGNISVDTAPAESSTTLFFNAKMGEADTKDTQKLSDIAKNYIDYNYASTETGLGINLDLTQDHKMSEANVNNGKLGATSKKTNIILIGQKAYKEFTDKDSRTGLDLSFFDDKTPTDEQYKYTYTIISGGKINTKVLNQYNSYFSFIDTTLFGPRNFAQRDFIDTSKKESGVQDSSWGGGQDIHQFLIFDFQQGQGYINERKGDAIVNTSTESRYIFTNIFKNNNNVDRVLTLGTGGLKGAINAQLKEVGSANKNADTISTKVTGYLGLRGVSIEGDINENTNGVDIVFNSTKDISYIEGFDSSSGLKHTFTIKKTGKNEIANSNYKAGDISGYATLGNGGKEVTISGNADKDIVFIGENAVEGGFDKLKIKGGTQKSNYTFHSVGTLDGNFLANVGLRSVDSQGNEIKGNATAGNFTFEASIIDGNINVNADPANKLTFENVIYSGKLSGNLKKDLHFAQGSKDIFISGGSDDSVYNFGDSDNPVDGFSNVTSIDNLNIDLRKDAQGNYYYASKVKGFDGNTSLSGSLRLAKSEGEVVTPQGPNQELYSNSFTFKDNAKWTVTGQSRVMNLTLSNTGNSYNLEIDPLANQARMRNTPTQTPIPMLEVGTFSSTNGRALIWTDITSDQNQPKAATIKADTFKGTLYVAAKDKVLKGKDFKRDEANEIVLVEAGGVVGVDSWIKGESVKEGLRHSMTTLEHQEWDDDKREWKPVTEETGATQAHQRWVLDSFETQENKELVDEASSLISNPYRMLLIETNNLNKRMGELRDNDYAQGAWIRVFNGMDSGEGTKNLYTNVQLGYDYAFGVIGAKNYTGGAFSTSIADISGNQYNGKGNTYSIALYNSYIADNGLYVDAIAKYLYMDQRLTPKGQGESKFGNHAYSLGAEVGYRVPITETNFFVEAQGEVVGGIIQGMKDVKLGTYEGVAAWGDLETTPSLSLRAGIVAGYTLKTQSGFRADFRLGASLVSEFAKGGSVVLQDGIDAPIHSSIKNDNKVVLNLGTNLILTDKWRIYIDAERSFGGSRNTDYQASVGARFSFGKVVKSIPNDEIAPIKLKEEEKKDAQAQTEQEVKKEEVKAEQAPKAEKVEDKKADTQKADVKKTEAKKAETKAKKQPAKKQAKKQAQAKKPTAKKTEANKAKSTNKTAQTSRKKGGDWGWW